MPARHPTGTLAATIVGSSLAFIDGSVVNVALPAIERDLASSGASGATIAWLINAYLLPLGALVLVGGVGGDRYGRKRVFLVGVALFAAASLGCALAPGFASLLAARALQGIGAALLVPTSLALLGAAFEGEARGRAVGTWAAAAAVTSALGPVVGGWLVDTVGWRAIFLINLPFAAVAGWLAWRRVDESWNREAAPLDVVGAALATIGLALLTWGLTIVAARGAGAVGAGPATGAMAALAGLACLAAFVGVEARLGARALMPLALFGTRTLLTVGPVVVAIGFALFLPTGAGPVRYATQVLPALACIAVGLTLSVAPLTTAVIAAVDPAHVGSASGFNNATSRIAGQLATALLGYVLAGDAAGPAFFGRFHGAAVVGALLALAAGASAIILCAPVSETRGRRAPAPPAESARRSRRRS
jgi:MFS family permease